MSLFIYNNYGFNISEQLFEWTSTPLRYMQVNSL